MGRIGKGNLHLKEYTTNANEDCIYGIGHYYIKEISVDINLHISNNNDDAFDVE